MSQENSPDFHRSIFVGILKPLKYAQLVSPRGQLIKELENYSYTLPYEVRFQSFACRKFKLNYVKQEVLWYLRGDKFDLSICDKAKMWKDLVNHDGSINSNYGQYIFNSTSNQFNNVVNTLKLDKDSRRASMTILNSEHLFSNTKDVPCTYALNFRIRKNVLNMSVLMRSQDAFFGMANDAPAFSIMFEMMFHALKEFYPDLEQGSYHHHCNSFHVYERHFEMLDNILAGDEYSLIKCPEISGFDEVKFLRELNFSTIPDRFEFSKWLTS